MVGVKDTKISIAVAWVIATVLFFVALKIYPAWSDAALRKAFLILFSYIALMFGLTWKFMWKLIKGRE